MTKIFFLLFYLISANFSCTPSHQSMKDVTDTIFQIDFQDFFSKDRVELKVNACSVFGDTLTSDKSDGLTNMRISIFQNGQTNYLIKYKDKSVECDLKTKDINLEVALNGYRNSYKVDFTKGKYIGISKKNKNEVTIIQSKEPFIYD